MRKSRRIILVFGMVLMLIIGAPISVIAGGTPNGQPFQEIWEELEDIHMAVESRLIEKVGYMPPLTYQPASEIDPEYDSFFTLARGFFLSVFNTGEFKTQNANVAINH